MRRDDIEVGQRWRPRGDGGLPGPTLVVVVVDDGVRDGRRGYVGLRSESMGVYRRISAAVLTRYYELLP